MKKSLAVLFILSNYYVHVAAQSLVNTPSYHIDTAYYKEPDAFKRMLPKLWVLPTAAIGYGLISLHNGELKELDQQEKYEVAVEHPHRPIHIDNYLQWSPAAAVYALNVMGVNGKHNFTDRSVIYGISTVIMASTVFATKDITHQLRPDGSDHNSFPSGHTATAFAAAEFMRKEYQDVSIWYGVAGYAAAATTGYLRMYNNKHWLSDVVAGAGVGILSTDLAYLLYPTVKRLVTKKDHLSTIAMPYYQDGTIGLSIVHHF